MKFNLKLFVLVGVLAGFRDVCGTEENKDYDGFIVAGFWENKELKDAMDQRRVIKAVYKTPGSGNVFIIGKEFKDKLSSILVWDVKKGKDVKADVVNILSGCICYDMEKKVEYTVYFIFKQECFAGTAEELLLSTTWMFIGCKDLIQADFRYFDTEKVKDMSYMFRGCSSLTILNLSKFDTKNITNMSSMFDGCIALTELDLSKFDTQNVTNMSGMFSNCAALTKLDLSKFNTTKVSDMSSMFAECTVLTKLDLSKFNTKKVTSMYHMFNGCIALKELNLSKFDFSSVNDMREIFQACGFENLYLPKKYEYTRKKFLCCGDIVDRYVYINGERVEDLDPKNVVFVDGVAG